MTLPHISADDIQRHVTPLHAVDALERALAGDVDPAADAPRSSLATADGELLLMPAEAEGRVGVKIAGVAPGNPAKGRERIQGVYVLMKGDTLEPEAIIDGPGITTLRTAAVSALAARRLAPERASRLVVFGTGPQARAHIEAIRAVRPIEEVVVIGRDGYKEEGLAAFAIERGLRARTGHAVAHRRAIEEADIVACATTAREPLFEGEWVGDGALVVAVGSHEPDARELPASLLRRSSVIVEDVETAMREAGDVILAIEEGACRRESLLGLRDVVRGEPALGPGPRVFKSVGQSWEDLVVASEIVARVPRRSARYPVGGVGRARRGAATFGAGR